MSLCAHYATRRVLTDRIDVPGSTAGWRYDFAGIFPFLLCTVSSTVAMLTSSLLAVQGLGKNVRLGGVIPQIAVRASFLFGEKQPQIEARRCETVAGESKYDHVRVKGLAEQHAEDLHSLRRETAHRRGRGGGELAQEERSAGAFQSSALKENRVQSNVQSHHDATHKSRAQPSAEVERMGMENAALRERLERQEASFRATIEQLTRELEHSAELMAAVTHPTLCSRCRRACEPEEEQASERELRETERQLLVVTAELESQRAECVQLRLRLGAQERGAESGGAGTVLAQAQGLLATVGGDERVTSPASIRLLPHALATFESEETALKRRGSSDLPLKAGSSDQKCAGLEEGGREREREMKREGAVSEPLG
eukprot:3370583-Rhodomonas_salina.1